LYPGLRVVNGYPALGDDRPVGQQTLIANRRPMFGWELTGHGPQATQSAYRIIVARDQDGHDKLTGDMWDSGKVDSAESTNVIYDGAPLAPDTAYFWRVMVWD